MAGNLRRSPRRGALVVLLVLSAAVVPLSVGFLPATTAAAPSERGPILIDGDADLCDDEDGDGAVGQDDGIVNCATADGTAQRPYLIASWSFDFWPERACVDGYAAPVPSSGCPTPVACPGDTHAGAIVVCRTTKHVVLQDLTVAWAFPLFVACTDDDGGSLTSSLCGPGAPPPNEAASQFAPLNLVANGNVTVRRVAMDAYGLAVRVLGASAAAVTAFEEFRLASSSDSAVGPYGDPESDGFGGLPAVQLEGASVRFLRSSINATGHEVGIQARGWDGGPFRFEFLESTFASALVTGISVDGDYAVTLQDSVVGGVGVSDAGLYHSYEETQTDQYGSTTAFPSRALQFSLGAAPLTVVGNRIQVRGWAVEANGNGTALFEANVFDDLEGQRGTNEIALYLSTYCDARANYNSFHSARVILLGRSCVLDARHNWWGRDTGPRSPPQQPQADGPVTVEPWLLRPIEELPQVAVTFPGPGASAAGRLELRGTALSPTASALTRVEVSSLPNEWLDARAASGLAEWSYAWDLSLEPLGPRSLWVRGCDERDCGVPARVDVVNLEPRGAPIAVLRATPRVVAPGEPVALDASASYSPQGHPVTAYRFAYGDGRETDWSAAPRLEVRYDEAGSFTTTVQVRDDANVSNSNVASVTLRVAPGGDTFGGQSGPGAIPGAEALPAALALLAAALLVRRRLG